MDDEKNDLMLNRFHFFVMFFEILLPFQRKNFFFLFKIKFKQTCSANCSFFALLSSSICRLFSRISSSLLVEETVSESFIAVTFVCCCCCCGGSTDDERL